MKQLILIALLITGPLQAVSATQQVPLIPKPCGFISIEECQTQNIAVDFLLEETPTSQFVARFPHGIVINEGGILTSTEKILLDTETYGQDQHKLMKGRIPTKQIWFDGTLAVVSSPGQENWYHWLLQVLPRLKILSEYSGGFDKIYINNLTYQWQKDSLALVCKALNIPEDKFLIIEGDILIQAKTLVVPSVPYIPSRDRPSLPVWLKQFLSEVAFDNQKRSGGSDKIYISRSNARCRRITNENELIEVLKRKGFDILHLEDLSMTEQAWAFYNAKIIIGPHGSGFANLLFTRPETTLIEIDHELEGPEQRSCFKSLARKMSCAYVPLYTDLAIEANLETDLTVDIAACEQLISKIITN